MSKTFKFADAYIVRAGIVIWNGVCLPIVVGAGSRAGIGGLLLALALSGPFFWCLQMYAFVKTMEVVVDDDGLRRCYRGRQWLSVRWDEIGSLERRKRILDPVSGGKPREVTYLHIGLIEKLPVAFLRIGKLVFSSQMAGFDEFLDLVRQNVKVRRIELEEA